MAEQAIFSGDGLLKEAVNGRQSFSSVVAQHVFKRYIALLYRLCVEEGNDYDLLVGPGDSGAVMVHFAELFYKVLEKQVPPKLLFPVQRYVDPDDERSGLFDNSALLPTVAEQLASRAPSRVLFVDDEIWQANSASASARLLVSAIPAEKKLSRVVFTIVAENHGFEWHYDLPPIAIQYYAFSKRIVGVNNAILRLLSEDQQTLLNQLTQPYLERPEIDGQTRKMDILFNGYVKVSSRAHGVAPHYKHISPHAELLQFKDEVEARLTELIHEAIEEYTHGEIKFVF